jgi:hypothetical protein
VLVDPEKLREIQGGKQLGAMQQHGNPMHPSHANLFGHPLEFLECEAGALAELPIQVVILKQVS